MTNKIAKNEGATITTKTSVSGTLEVTSARRATARGTSSIATTMVAFLSHEQLKL